MPITKNALIRYQKLDKCFRNPGRMYFANDLLDACNDALQELEGEKVKINRRQLFYDIRFMESEQGYSIPLERHQFGKKVYYRYEDMNFSISNQPLNENEANQLKETLTILNRFKGMPQFDWIEEMFVRLETTFCLKDDCQPIVGFEQNPYLKGLNFFSELFNAIQYKKVLSIKYQGFRQNEAVDYEIHPYFLKQFNSRWFLFGLNEKFNNITNLALDRIIALEEARKPYIINKEIDFTEYFEDIIGVTFKDQQKPQKIILQIKRDFWPYIETKPIHGSQKIKVRDEENILIELELQINYELCSLIFSYGENVKVIEPSELKDIIKTKAEALLKNYF